MDRLKQLLITVLAVIADEELLGMYLEDVARTVVKPFVFAYVCGTIAVEHKNRIVKLIEPKTPNFSLN